jgi:hypothetical protein
MAAPRMARVRRCEHGFLDGLCPDPTCPCSDGENAQEGAVVAQQWDDVCCVVCGGPVEGLRWRHRRKHCSARCAHITLAESC